jgi:acetyltransferase-like isoleucine patch superfamily enzyme
VVALGYGYGPAWASRARGFWVRFRNPQADIRIGRGCYLGPGFSIHTPAGGTFVCGDYCEFRRGFRAELGGPDARIEIGGGSRFTYDALIQCGRSITIGRRVIVAQASMIVDGNHRFRDLSRPMLEQGYDLRPVTIEDDAFITSKCTVIASVGTRSVVGANSVATRDIPAYSVAVGAPARVIDYFGPDGAPPRELSAALSDRSG